MKVQVYRNLHKNCWSVKHKGKVVAHLDELVLVDCVFRVQPAGRLKVLKTRTKNVHAYVCGSMVTEIKRKTPVRISYNPYKHAHFYYVGSESPITECKSVKFDKDGRIYELI